MSLPSVDGSAEGSPGDAEQEREDRVRAEVTAAQPQVAPSYANLGEVTMHYGDRGLAGEPHDGSDYERPAALNNSGSPNLDPESKSRAETGAAVPTDDGEHGGTLASRKAGLPFKQDEDL